jgi:hypothetical protein
MSDMENVKVAAQVITVPEHIEYPELRIPLDPGTLRRGDIVLLSLKVVNNDGREKYSTEQKMLLKEYPDSKEVLAVAYVNFVESNRGAE